jgi:2-amino-1-hydroxyethylphosphonate dioxygenase (glycine-forming)
MTTSAQTSLRDLFSRHGNRDYIGEDGVSQLSHALQCAMLAEEAGEDPSLIIAALCHDVGHLLVFAGRKVELMGRYGVKGHEDVGAAWLQELGFPTDVTAPVADHVRCKRYMVHASPAAAAALSPASVNTLRYQGGPMNADEAEAFAATAYFAPSMRLRGYDNAAKVPGLPTPPLEHFLALIPSVITRD